METPEMAGEGRGVGFGDGRVDLTEDPLVRTRIFEPIESYVFDSSPAVGSRAWWEGEALESAVHPYDRVSVAGIPVTPEEDEAWERHAGST